MIRRFLIANCFLASILFVSACSPTVTVTKLQSGGGKKDATPEIQPVEFPDDSPSIPDGKAVWEKMKCAECHGVDGHGISGKASADLARPSKSGRGSPIFHYKLLAYGVSYWDHPRLKNKLSVREIWDLVFFVRAFESPPLSDAELEAMEPVYGANCADCHGQKGYGDGPLGHNLAPLPANFHQFSRFFDREDAMLNAHITEGLYPSAMPSFLGREDRANGVVFDEKYIEKLVRYVRSFYVANKPTDIGGKSQPTGEDNK